MEENKESRTKKETALLAAEALKVVAVAASEALTKVAADAASAQVKVAVDIEYIKSSIGEIKADMKAAQVYYATSVAVKETNDCIKDHETRLRSMESSVWKFVGAFSVISATIGVLGGRVSELIFR